MNYMTKIILTEEARINGLWISIDTFDTGKKSISVLDGENQVILSGITPLEAENLADTLLEIVVDKNI